MQDLAFGRNLKNHNLKKIPSYLTTHEMLRGAAAIQQQVQQQVQQKKGNLEAHAIQKFFKPCSEQRYQNNLVSSYMH